MSYGVEIEGETTLIGWDENGCLKPWSEIEASAVLIQLRREFMDLGDFQPAMRIVSLPHEKVCRHTA